MIIVDKNLIGKKIKKYRRKKGWTQDFIAEKTGISEKHFGKLERGLFVPSLETFFNLIDILDIPIY